MGAAEDPDAWQGSQRIGRWRNVKPAIRGMRFQPVALLEVFDEVQWGLLQDDSDGE